MSDLYINIRFGSRHFQIHMNKPYVSFKHNNYWEYHPPKTWFFVYQWFSKNWSD